VTLYGQRVQGGKDAWNVQDALSLSVIIRKKSPILSGSFAERDLQLKASCATSSPCSSELTFAIVYTGCLKLQVSFRKRATNYRALLLRITSKGKITYACLPACIFTPYTPKCVVCCSVLQRVYIHPHT